MGLESSQVEPSQRILADYVETLQMEIVKLAEEMRIARDEELRHALALQFQLKTQLVEDLQRCIGIA